MRIVPALAELPCIFWVGDAWWARNPSCCSSSWSCRTGYPGCTRLWTQHTVSQAECSAANTTHGRSSPLGSSTQYPAAAMIRLPSKSAKLPAPRRTEHLAVCCLCRCRGGEWGRRCSTAGNPAPAATASCSSRSWKCWKPSADWTYPTCSTV